jgi:DNA-binding NarL/FixJ family response regulator
LSIKVAIVDDKFINRKTLKEKLAKMENIVLVQESENGEAFYNSLLSKNAEFLIDVVLVDLEMPKMNGIETISACKQVFPHMKFIVLTIFEDTDRIFEAICAGANGYLLKEDLGLNIEEAIKNTVDFNGIPMSPTIARKAMDLIKLNNSNTSSSILPEKKIIVTDREIEILKLLTTGLSYPKIGEKLFISPLTVRKHVANIYEKLHVNSRTQLILLAQEKRLI